MYIRHRSAEVNIRVEPPIWWHDNWPCTEIVLSVHKGSVDRGEKIMLHYGAGLQKAVVSKMAGETFVFDALVDSDGLRSRTSQRVHFVESGAPVVTIPDEPCRMEIFIPSVISDNTTEALVVKKDAHHNCVSAERKAITLSDARVTVSENGPGMRVELRDNEVRLIGVILQSESSKITHTSSGVTSMCIRPYMRLLPNYLNPRLYCGLRVTPLGWISRRSRIQ